MQAGLDPAPAILALAESGELEADEREYIETLSPATMWASALVRQPKI